MRISFPTKGIYKGTAAASQPDGTSPDMNNVRPRDVLEHRVRGGQRPGLQKLYSQQIGGAAVAIVAICSVTTID